MTDCSLREVLQTQDQTFSVAVSKSSRHLCPSPGPTVGSRAPGLSQQGSVAAPGSPVHTGLGWGWGWTDRAVGAAPWPQLCLSL